ncbi:MAG: molybdenum cofactor guanylyltransferase [Acidobacteria bacterium]|nr:molybdenum cofactor guanylyltransferase [Acidobacteriota bacterium]
MSGLLENFAAYILAGGRSTRMGQDKAMLELAGRPLVEHAVRKLRSITPDVCILSGNPAMARFAPPVADLHVNCGPLGGIEAALSDSKKHWVLIVPVDTPFVPAALLRYWANDVLRRRDARVSLFAVDGAVQPALCLVHRDLASYVRESLEAGRLKLFPELKGAAEQLATRMDARIEDVLLVRKWDEEAAAKFLKELESAGSDGAITAAQRVALPVWFSNLNTPDEFTDVERYADALEEQSRY